MCGLVGIASAFALNKTEKEVFEDLLFVDTLRGEHSTGVFSVHPKEGVDVFKKAIDGPSFLQLKVYEQLFRRPHGFNVLAGHNRKATIGSVNDQNAHPFHHGDIVLMHNGTLRTQYQLDKHTLFGTDSEAIAYNLSEADPDQAHEVIKKLNGAFALVWWDTRDETLNFIRNSERTLYIGSVTEKDPKTIAWASEASFLNLAFNRPGRNLKLEKIDLLRPMHHYKLDLSGSSVDLKSMEKYEEYVLPKTVYYGRGGSSVNGDSPKSTGGSQSGSGDASGNKSNVSPLPNTYLSGKPDFYPSTGDIIEASPVSFQPYGHSPDKGKVVCTIPLEKPNKDVELGIVELHQCIKSDFNKWEGSLIDLRLRVTNICWDYMSRGWTIQAVFLEAVKVEKSKTEVEKEAVETAESLSEAIQKFNKDREGTVIEGEYKKEGGPEEEEGTIQGVYEEHGLGDLEFIRGFNNTLLTYNEFKKKAKFGCAQCSCDLFLQESDSIIWEDDQTPFCSDCGTARQMELLGGSTVSE